MTDTQTPATPPSAPAPAPAPTLAPNTLGLVAVILAGLGFVMGVIPATSGLAWLLLLPALVLAIIGLTRRGQKKGTSIAALIVAVVGWIVALIVAASTFIVGVGEAINDAPSAASEAEPGSEPAESTADEASIGDTVTNDDGVAFTVSAITCGIPTAGPEFLTETASGQFCEVRYTILNGSTTSVSLFASDITGYIGEAKYDANTTISTFGDDMFSTDLNPGLSVDSVVYIDIPADAALEYIKYEPLFSFTGGVTVKAS